MSYAESLRVCSPAITDLSEQTLTFGGLREGAPPGEPAPGGGSTGAAPSPGNSRPLFRGAVVSHPIPVHPDRRWAAARPPGHRNIHAINRDPAKNSEKNLKKVPGDRKK